MSIASSYWFVHSKVCKEGSSHVKGSYSNERERRKERKKEGRGEKEEGRRKERMKLIMYCFRKFTKICC